MANIKFYCIKKTNPSNMNIRFYHGRNIDCNAQSHILIDPNLWSRKMQNFKPLTNVEVKNTYLPLIENLKKEIQSKFNLAFSNGELINSKQTIKITLVFFVEKFFSKPVALHSRGILRNSSVNKFWILFH
jgi:hypothetical protein